MATDTAPEPRVSDIESERNGASPDDVPSFSYGPSADPRIACALDLGWRIAALYGGAMSYVHTNRGNSLLPTATSLAPRDRLELELFAATGYAVRLGVPFEGESFKRLQELACRTGDPSHAAERKFRDALCESHVSLDKRLWRISEKEGCAYELGIMLFDTWSRIRLAYENGHAAADVSREWREVFGGERVKYLLTLIDDLQSRLDPGAVTVVRDNVESWRERVEERVDKGQLPTVERPWEEVRNQAVVWRQLLSGDKQPEAYLGPQERALVRTELTRLMWKRYSRVLVCAVPVLAGAVIAGFVFGDEIASWYSDNSQMATIATGAAASIAALLGISKASIVRAARNSLRVWSELLWNRALSRVVCRETLRVDNVFPAEHPLRQRFALAVTGWWKKAVVRILRLTYMGRKPRPSH